MQYKHNTVVGCPTSQYTDLKDLLMTFRSQEGTAMVQDYFIHRTAYEINEVEYYSVHLKKKKTC